MTRFLSQALEASEPFFSLQLRKLEAAHGNLSHDVRLSADVQGKVRSLLGQLGADPRDTTPEEVYHLLQERVKADDARLTRTLRTQAATHISAEGDIISGMAHIINQLSDSKRCFAIKTSVLKNLLKHNPPKKSLKKLGYRSLESCLKHEPVIPIVAAAWLCEGRQWQQRLLNQYKQLTPTDFEDRRINVFKAHFKRWPTLAEDIVAAHKQNILSFRELGALILLPLPHDVLPGMVTASLGIALHELNEIRATSTYLKLCQVRPDFAEVVCAVIKDEPRLDAQLLDHTLSWNLIHRYYAQLGSYVSERVFEPYLQLEDIAWQPIEKTLAAIEPSLAFWQQSDHAGVLHERQPVSLNIIDAALNCCNQLSFKERTARYFQRSLWHELILRYLRHDTVEDLVVGTLQPQLAEEMVEA